MPKIYVWDFQWHGAFVVVASSAAAAAAKWNEQYPNGVERRAGVVYRATPEVFEEHDIDEVVSC